MTTMTQTRDEQWEALIASQGDGIIPPNYSQQGDIIETPDGTPLRISELRFKGYVPVWDTLSGKMSLQPRWLLWQTMRLKRADGSQVFTTKDPHIPQDYGEDLFCPLNPASPDHARFKGMGFNPCRKRHIPHQDALQRHVSKSHKRAWQAMERQRQDALRAEDRELQRRAIETQERFMEQLLGRAVAAKPAVADVAPFSEDAPLYVSEKPRKLKKPKSKR